jgi:hypothetical protein
MSDQLEIKAMIQSARYQKYTLMALKIERSSAESSGFQTD